jgi:outer membrane receptor protein involved in Fe transport
MMRAYTKILLVVIGLNLPVKAGSPSGLEGREPAVIGVLDFAVLGDVGTEIAGVMEAMLVQEIEGLGRVRVIGEEEVRALLTAQKQEHLVDFEWKCPAEGFLEKLGDREPAVRWVVAGQVTRFGKLYVLSLKLFDLKSRTVAGRVIRRTRGDPGELQEELSDATQMLFEEAADRVGVEIIVKTVTTAARHRQLIEESPSAVTVLTREDIEASGADSIPNLLRLVPGMDVIVSSGAFQSISSRLNWNYEGNNYLVLVDGREINYDPLGFPPWEAQPIFLEDIQRIEVIRGPASSLYGANAFAGVVSITTREIPERTSASIITSMGEAGRTVAGLRASSKLGDWGVAISGGADLAGEFIDPRTSSKRIWKIRALVERRFPESRRFLIDLGLSSGEGPFASSLGTVKSNLAPFSVRLAYESEVLRGQLYWNYSMGRFQIDTPIEYNGVRLADFMPAPVDSHVVDAQLQWTPPRFWEPLLFIVGGGARTSWVFSNAMLDAGAFTNPASSGYHQMGIDYQEVRGGAFVHAEYALAEWITLTGGTRIDYDTQTDWFASPRLAAVIEPVQNQYLRVGVARSFRKPSFIETACHLAVEFPEDGPIQGTAQDSFLEFMTRVGGGSDLDNEELFSFEAGYLGRFLDGRLSVGLDLYYNRYRDQVQMDPNIHEGEQGLPDLERSSFIFKNEGPDLDVFGGEFSVRFSPSSGLSFLASWTHRQIYDYSAGRFSGNSPKNLITLGGSFRTAGGLLGSLYAFARSEFRDVSVENPSGILQPLLTQHMDNVLLLMGKLGRRFELGQHVRIEMGIKLFLPVSPFAAPHFRSYEAGGGIPPTGKRYGAEQLGRMVTGYLEGAF